MKFVCDRCGKKYATAGDPAPGKVYKLKCKACGHLIVVRGQAGTTTGLPALSASDAAAAAPVQELARTQPTEPPPEIVLQVEPDPRAAAPLPTPAPLPPEVALAVDSAAGAPLAEPAAPPPVPLDLPDTAAPLLDPALTPPPPEKDELADFAAAAAEVMAAPVPAGELKAPGYVDLFADGGERKADDPFAAAARASLPDTWAGATPPATRPEPRPATPIVAPARVAPQRSGLGGAPMVIIGLGLLVLAGIAAWALLGRRGPPPPPVAAAPRTEPAPTPPRPIEPEVKPPAPAPAAEPAPEPRAAEKQPEPKARPPERKPEKRPEPKAAEKRPEPARPPAVAAAAPVTQAAPPPPPPPPAPEPRAEIRDELPDAATALTQDVVNKVVGANRRAFSTCIAAGAGSGVKLDGRRVALRITVNTNGTVTYPTLDDQELNTTEMGQCLKSAARLMIFPKFRGDPFHYEVPLILTGS